ncbi:hypothetical protein COOONC_08834 [Cooperia oncophora]
MTSPSVKLVQMDRLPLPVTISFIRSKVSEGESFQIGNKRFRKVLCVGRIESCRAVRSIGALEYVISDPSPDGSTPSEISVLYVDESYDVSRPTEKFPRGTLVLVPGKLMRFKGNVAIQAYSIREILCQEEYDCLRMEAFLAVQYHTKNPSGQTPARRPSTGSKPRRSSSTVTPSPSVAGKRVASPAVVCISTPKRPITSVRSSSSSSLLDRSGGDLAQNGNVGAESAAPAHCHRNSSLNEVGSQDSFEDTVFMKT